MNNTYRVVFSKARGALMVANEITSCVQKKGTATVVAAALMGVVASAMAQTGAEAPAKPTESITWDQVSKDFGTTKVVDGFVGKAGSETGVVADSTGSGATLDGYTFSNNVSQGKGGALVLGNTKDKGYAVNNTTFTNNSAAGFGGAIRLLSAKLSVSATDKVAEGAPAGKANEPTHILMSGNMAGTKKTNTAVPNKDKTANDFGNMYEDMGGFAHLQGGSELNLSASGASSITVGEYGAHQTANLDSISSSNSGNTVNINAADNASVTVNGSMRAFTGKLNVSGNGHVALATGFGEIDNTIQSQVNGAADLSASKFKPSKVEQSVLTVGDSGNKSNPHVSMGDLNITKSITTEGGKAANPTAGTLIDVQSGELTITNLHVGSKEYHDREISLADGKYKPGSYTTTGYGEVKVGTHGHVDVQGVVSIEDKSKLALTSGTMFVGAVDIKSGGAFDVAEGKTLRITGTGGDSINAGTLGGAGAIVVGGSDYDLSLTNTGKIQGSQLHIQDGATVNTSISADHYAVQSLIVDKGGIFNVTSPNSKLEGVDLVLFGSGDTVPVIKLDGGRIFLKGSEFKGGLKLGSASGAASLSLNNGAYTLRDVSFGSYATGQSGSVVTVGANGSLDITGTLDLSTSGKVTINNSGSVTLNKVKLTDKSEVGSNVSITNSKGASVTSTISTFATVTKDKETISEVKSFGLGSKLSSQQGMMYATDSITLTKAELEKFNSAFNSGNFVLVNAIITGNNGNGLTWGDVNSGFTSPNTVVTVEGKDGVASISGSTSGDVKAVIVKNVDTGANKTVNVQTSGGLTIAGTGGQLFGSGAETVNVSGGNLTLGYQGRESSGTIGAAVNVTSGALSVAAGDFSATNGLSVSGAQAKLNVTGGDLSVSNGLTLGQSGTVSVSDGRLDVDHFDDSTSGSVILGTGGVLGVASSVTTVTPSKPSTLAVKADGPTIVDTGAGPLIVKKAIYIGQNAQGAKVGFGATAAQTEAAVTKALGAEADTLNTYYVAKQVDLQTEKDTVTLGSGYGLVVDVAGVANTQGFDASKGAIQGKVMVSGSTNPKIVLQNLTGKALKVSGDSKSFVLGGEGSNLSGATVDFGTIFYGDKITAVKSADGQTTVSYTGESTLGNGQNGSIAVKANAEALKALDAMHLDMGAMVKQAIENVDLGTNSLVDQIVYGTGEFLAQAQNEAAQAGVTGEDAVKQFILGKLEQYGATTNAVSNIAVTGGAFSAVMDVNKELNAVTQHRTSVLSALDRGTGVSPWVELVGSKNVGKKLYGNGFGYESSIYGVSLGADTVTASGTVTGIQLSVGSGSSNSKGTAQKVDNDLSFYGVKAYAAQKFGAANALFDLGWTRTSNDLSTAGMSGVHAESLNADVVSLGANVEYLVQLGGVDLVPHAGLRYSRLSMDNSTVANYDTMNIVQMPIGVSVATKVKVGDAWMVAPMADLSVVPSLGDRDAVANYGNNALSKVSVLDTSPVQAKLGVSAASGNFEVGASYGLTAGSKSRLDNSFNMNMRFSF